LFTRRTATVEVFDGSSWKLQNYELTSPRYQHCAVPVRYTLYFDSKKFVVRFLLETTGGISFSLEGFEKSLFSNWNFTHGDFQSTGGFRYLSTGFIIPLERYMNPSSGIKKPWIYI